MLIAIVLITVLRSVIGFLSRVFVQLVRASATPAPIRETRQSVPLTGELKKDPICGTYIAVAGSLQKTIGEQTFYFCSQQCRDKFPARA